MTADGNDERQVPQGGALRATEIVDLSRVLGGTYDLGSHTREVLLSAGMSPAEIEQLVIEGVLLDGPMK